jgi:hypothetical protein
MAAPHFYFAAGTMGMPGAGIMPPVSVLARGGSSRPAPEPLQVLTTIEEVRAANRRALSMAQRLISIFTPDLEPKLYEYEPFLDVVQRFLLSHSFAKIRILTQRPVPYGTPHKLAAMRRRLSGHMEVRSATQQFTGRSHSMLIADSRAIVYRAQSTTYEGVAGFEQPPIAKLYLAEFDQIWVASAPKY